MGRKAIDPMNTALTTQPSAEMMEKVLLQGNLAVLTPAERLSYYRQVCESVGLNPLTRPFEYLTLNNKMVLYAKRECTEQLRKIHNVSILIVAREAVEGCYVVTARAVLPSNRQDESLGAVPIEGLKGEHRSNAMMKAECVPLDSEILTRGGWKSHNEVEVGEEVLAYDCASDTCRWTALMAITRYDLLPMIRMFSDKGQFEVRCTPDHSWAVQKKGYEPDKRTDGSRGPKGPYSNRRPDRWLLEASNIKASHRIIMAAAEVGEDESVLTPTEAAILGWAVTDGTIQRKGSYKRVGICQSKEHNFESIRELVGAGIRELVSPARLRTFPASGRTYECKPQHWWYLPAQASRDLLEKAGFESRADLPVLATRLNSAARKAMLQAFMLAEGDKHLIFANTDRHILDTFQILCALEGIAVGQEKPKTDNCHTIRKKLTRHIAGNFLNFEPIGSTPAWCPTTEFGTWVMRQNGRVLITGNTKAKRRVTLAICGLSFLDESEVESVRGAVHVVVDDAGEIKGVDPRTPEEVVQAKLSGAVPLLSKPEPMPEPPADDPKPGKKKGSVVLFNMLQSFQCLKKRYQKIKSEATYYAVLERFGVHKSNEFPDTDAGIAKARGCYKEMSLNVADLEVLHAKEHPPEDETPMVFRLPDAMEQNMSFRVYTEEKGVKTLWQVVQSLDPKGPDREWQEVKQ
jgi:hypothetical protein